MTRALATPALSGLTAAELKALTDALTADPDADFDTARIDRRSEMLAQRALTAAGVRLP